VSTQIKSQQLAEVLAVLLEPKLPGAGAEKRRATRIAVEAPVSIWPVVNGSPGTATTVLTRDISYSGVGLLLVRAVKSGDQFILKLPRAKADPMLVLCEVTFVKILAESLYGVGAQFVTILQQSKDIKPVQPVEAPAPTIEIPSDALSPAVEKKAAEKRAAGKPVPVPA
jgi:hypothetical protein